MKKLITILILVLISQVLHAQAPQATTYQAVIRNNSGNVLANQLVKVRFSIRDSSANGTIVYREIQTPTTNAQGLINLFAGQGTPVTGSFAGINWGSKSKYLQTEIDITGGNNYTDMGTTQLMSVPYALYANTANNGNPTGSEIGEMLYWNGTTWVKVTPGSYGQFLSLCDGVPTWGGCTPKVTTTAASTISYTTATSGGNVTAEGGISVTSRGVCWSTTINPTIALSTKTVNGTGAGSFTSSITGLTANTIYYLRAYATNSVGTTYGTQQTFNTLAYTTPILSTIAISRISNTTATSGGNVTTDGGATITARGVCWSTTTNPTIALPTKTIDGAGIGSFTSNLSGLIANTIYFVRAYATNSVGTSYGPQQTFTTTSSVLFPSVTIGTQVWSTQNLSVTRYRNGDLIPEVTDSTQWANLTTGAWCWYNNDSATYAANYGRLYNWYAVNDSRGLAPQGWHIPNETEWNKLLKFLDPIADTTCLNCTQSTSAGGAMKSMTGWNAPNTGATNSSGFEGVGGGVRNQFGSFQYIGFIGRWWRGASEFDATNGLRISLLSTSSATNRNIELKNNGFSVRLVKD